MVGVGIVEQSLPQHSLTSRDVLNSLYGEWSPGHVHFSRDLAHSQTLPQHLADAGHVLHRDSEGNMFVSVDGISVLRLRQHLPTKLSTHLPKVGTSAVILRPFGEFIIGNLAQLDDETSDSLEEEAVDLCGYELMPRGIGLGVKFEFVLVVHM